MEYKWHKDEETILNVLSDKAFEMSEFHKKKLLTIAKTIEVL